MNPKEEKRIEKHTEVLNKLLSNCKQSDREIAKFARVSQPTVTRIRAFFETRGIIRSYMAIPDYAKLGFSFGSVVTGQMFSKEFVKDIVSEYSVIMYAPSIALDKDTMLITLHRTIEDFNSFLKAIKDNFEVIDGSVVLFDTKGLEIKAVQLKAPPKEGA